MPKLELLAPAGKRASFIGAINGGANAIYLAGKRFGARGLAENFTKEEIKDLVSYAHLRNVLVYVTINTLIKDSEITDLLNYTDYLVQNSVDALIIQDLGILAILRKRYPTIKIHASTQLNTYSIDQVRMLKSLGVDRVILAREVSIEEIKNIKKNVSIELEVFVHGALCVSYSGNCLFSSIISDRSGNRGFCAQPCRLPFSLYQDNILLKSNHYFLSPKDLMTLKQLKQLEGLVDSIKIEGRLRSSEYVVQAVKAYRDALDNESFDFEKNEDLLKRTFNRGFTKGNIFNELDKHIFNQERPNHQGIVLGEVLEYNKPLLKIKLKDRLNIADGIRILATEEFGFKIDKILDINKKPVSFGAPQDIIYIFTLERAKRGDVVLKTLDSKLHEELSVYFNEEYKLIALNGKIDIFSSKEAILTICDDLKNIISCKGMVAMQAVSTPISKEDIHKQLSKLGNTPFYFNELIVNTDNNSFLPIKELNELRRKAIDELSRVRLKRNKPAIVIQRKELQATPKEYGNQLSIKVRSLEQLQVALNYSFAYIYYPYQLKLDLSNHKLIPYYPRISHHKSLYPKQLLADLGDLYNADESSFLIADKYFNCINTPTVATLISLGVDKVCLSDELTIADIKRISDTFYQEYLFYPNLEVMVYGAYELMHLKNNPLFKYNSEENLILKDRNKNNYFMKKDSEMSTTIFYKGKNWLTEFLSLRTIKNLSFRLELFDEDALESKKIIEKFLICYNKQ